MIHTVIGYAILAMVIPAVAGVALRARARRLRPREPLPRVRQVFLPHASVTVDDDGSLTVSAVPAGTPGAQAFNAREAPRESADTKADAAYHPGPPPRRSGPTEATLSGFTLGGIAPAGMPAPVALDEGWSPVGFTTGPVEFTYVDHDAIRDAFGRTEQEQHGNE